MLHELLDDDENLSNVLLLALLLQDQFDYHFHLFFLKEYLEKMIVLHKILLNHVYFVYVSLMEMYYHHLNLFFLIIKIV